DAVNQVKARLNLVDVVSQQVRLTKRGREFVGLCPFHQEKTPSFTLNEQMQSWYCFGCQKGGDLFTFVELADKTDFRGALESLADRAGVELQRESGAGRERAQLRRRIIEMNRLAAQYYEHVLWQPTPANRVGSCWRREACPRPQRDASSSATRRVAKISRTSYANVTGRWA